MENKIQKVRIMPTVSGNGYKVYVGEQRLVCSKRNFDEMYYKVKPYVTFRQFKEVVKGTQ